MPNMLIIICSLQKMNLYKIHLKITGNNKIRVGNNLNNIYIYIYIYIKLYPWVN